MPKSVRQLQEGAFTALKSAVKKAIAERTRLGLPVYVWKDGKVVDLNAPKRRTSAKRAKSTAAGKKASAKNSAARKAIAKKAR
jgi:hypothetical protein